MKTGDGATHRGFESHSLRQQKSAPIWGRFFVNEEAGFERATQAQPGEKLSGGQFLARGRIPAFPNAVRRTVGGKANAIKPAPIRGRFFVNEEAGFERATQAQPGEKLSGGQFLARGRIPAFPNAVRRTVGGKANAIKPAPHPGALFVNEEAGFERATQAQTEEKLSGGHLFF